MLSHLQWIFINISLYPLRLTLFVHLRILKYTKSAFPTRLSFTAKPSFHLLVFTHSQQGAPHSPCQIQWMSIHLYSSLFPYFPCSQFLPFLSFLPQHLVHFSVPHVRFTSQQNTKDIFVYYHKHVSLPASLHLLQNTIYILLTFSSLPFQKNVNPIFQIPPSTPLTNCPNSFYSAYHIFFNYVLIFHIQNSLPVITIVPPLLLLLPSPLNSVSGCLVLFKFWWK